MRPSDRREAKRLALEKEAAKQRRIDSYTRRTCKDQFRNSYTSEGQARTALDFMSNHTPPSPTHAMGIFLCGACLRWHVIPVPLRLENGAEIARLLASYPD